MKRNLALVTVAVFATFGNAALAQSNPPVAADSLTPPAAPLEEATFGPTFHKLDTDRDGFLSRDETGKLINFTTAFNDADGNRDGRLSPSEFAKAQAIHERVKAGTYASDSWITAKVKTALLRERAVRSLSISVETFRGVVQLSGFVNSEEQKRHAAAAAATVKGVVDVKNALIVKS
jgi:hyperosmotically inducible protein